MILHLGSMSTLAIKSFLSFYVPSTLAIILPSIVSFIRAFSKIGIWTG